MPKTQTSIFTPLSVVKTQAFATGAVSAQCATAFIQAARMVRCACTADCYVARPGTNPTATTNDMFLRAGDALYLAVQPNWKIAAIQATAAGTFTIAECE